MGHRSNGTAREAVPEIKRTPKTIVIELDSGLTAYVRPVNNAYVAALNERAKTEFPDVDPTPYEETVTRDNAPPLIKPATTNPEYQHLMAEVNAQRNKWVVDRLLLTRLSFDYNQEALMAVFEVEVATLREVAELPRDAWEATLFYCIIGTDGDRSRLIQAVRDALPLTEAEVTDAARLFRPDLQRT